MSKERSAAAASDGSPLPDKFPCHMAVRVIANGVAANGRLRLALVFTPIYDAMGEFDLANWPTMSAMLFSKDNAKLPRLFVGNLNTDGGRAYFSTNTANTSVAGEPKAIPIVPITELSATDIKAAQSHWLSVMGKGGFEALKKAFEDGAQKTGEATIKDIGGENHIHGMARGEAAVDLSLERARHILMSLTGRRDESRPAAPDHDPGIVSIAADNLVEELYNIGKNSTDKWPEFQYLNAARDALSAYHSSPEKCLSAIINFEEAADKKGTQEEKVQNAKRVIRGKADVERIVRNRLDREAAMKKLEPSRDLATDIRKAREKYFQAATPQAAVDALKNAPRPGCAPQQTAAVHGAHLDALRPSGTGDARAAQQLTSQKRRPDKEPSFDDETKALALRKLNTLYAYPSLARVFGLIIDVTVDLDNFVKACGSGWTEKEIILDADIARGKPSGQPVSNAGETANCWFAALGLSLDVTTPTLWTTAKLRNHQQLAVHFLPCAREEIDARVLDCRVEEMRKSAIVEQIDGVVDLGQCCTKQGMRPRFDIVTLDMPAAIVGDGHFEAVRATEALAEKTHPGTLEISERRRASLRTGGLALVDRWRQAHLVAQIASGDCQHQRKVLKLPVLLDSTDLTTGYKLDVGVLSRGQKSRRHWHTLMDRKLVFSNPGQATVPPASVDPSEFTLETLITKRSPPDDHRVRRRADGAQIAVPTAIRAPSDEHKEMMVFAEEIAGVWRGEPMGLATGADTLKLAQGDLAVNITGSLAFNTDFGGDSYPGGDSYTPPPLRFGWRYHFGMRAVFAGGVSLPLERAIAHYEINYARSLAMPPTLQPGKSYRRHERINAPQALLPLTALGPAPPQGSFKLKGRFPLPQGNTMVVRSLKQNDRMLGAGDDLSEGWTEASRIILPPATSLDMATMHGAFDHYGKKDFDNVPALLQPRILKDKDDVVADEEGCTQELTTSFVPQIGQQWTTTDVAWKPITIISRPRGGLKGVDRHTAWGGFPLVAPRSAQATIPKPNTAFVKTAGFVTDEAVIHQNRSTLDGAQPFAPKQPKFSKGVAKDWIQQLTWNAARPPSGQGIFRLAGPNPEPERDPFYPDPASEALVVRATLDDGRVLPPIVVQLYATPGLRSGVPVAYPDIIPLLLKVIQGDRASLVVGARGLWSDKPEPVSAARKQAPATRAAVGGSQPITVNRVTLSLAPGERATLHIWALPSCIFLMRAFEGTEALAALLANCDCTPGNAAQDLRTLDAACCAALVRLANRVIPNDHGSKVACGPAIGGLAVGSESTLLALADCLYEHMKTAPLPEISAPHEMIAHHAVDVPFAPPSRLSSGDISSPLPLWRIDSPDDLLSEMFSAVKRTDPPPPALIDQPGATGILLGGYFKIAGVSTGTVEFSIVGAAVARGRLDDASRGRSRDDRARGLWPMPDGTPLLPHRLYGFTPLSNGSVAFPRERAVLLRIDGIDAGETSIDLLAAQARAIMKPTEALRAARLSPIADGRARWLRIHAVAGSRDAGALVTRVGERPERTTTLDENPVAAQWLRATVRPPRVAGPSLLPSFRWGELMTTKGGAEITELYICREVMVRVRMKRPWFGSGEDERLGIVLWPPNLFENDVAGDGVDRYRPVPGENEINLADLPSDGGDQDWQQLQDADLGPGGAWVSRWGADPIKVDNQIKGWLITKDHFPACKTASDQDWSGEPAHQPDPAAPLKNIVEPWSPPSDGVVVGRALMPLPSGADAAEKRDADPAGGFMAVALVTYRARFDPVEEEWYADIPLSTRTALEPFVRVGLVRYQPHAPAELAVSEPVAQWTKLLPKRTMRARRAVDVVGAIDVTLEGPANETTDDGNNLPLPRVRMTLLAQSNEALQPTALPRDAQGNRTAKARDSGPAHVTWTCRFLASDFGQQGFDASGQSFSVHIEEVDLMRPATYPDEPRWKTIEDHDELRDFAETGPRFMGLLPLDKLKNSGKSR